MSEPRPIEPRLILGLSEIASDHDALICDIWGVVHNGQAPFPEAVQALRRFRRDQGKVVLLSNAPRMPDAVEEQFRRIGVATDFYDAIVTSGGAARLLIDTHVREDHIHLYGFVEEAERSWFRLLLTVQGVGARTALAILGTLSPDQLANAILAQDKSQVTRADGVGPKLAARILVELKDKVAGLAPVPVLAEVPDGATSDAVSALVNLGYQRGDAYGVIAEIARKLGPEARLDSLIKAGLKELGR